MNVHRGTILVVEDTPESLMMLTNLLTADGYQVRPADSGDLALVSVEAETPDLILLDIRMPGMDGFEVSRRLKAREHSRDIPIVFISALTAIEERVEGLRLGAVDFISKPFQKEELLARVATHIELGRLRLRLEQQVAERTAELKIANERLQVELNERIRAEQALRESEELFRNMANAAPVMIWLKDSEGRLCFCNRYALTLTGCTIEELVAGRWHEIIHPEDRPRRTETVAASFGARTDFQDEYRVLCADGRYRWMLESATPRFQAGAFAGFVGVTIDITEVRRNQEQLVAEQKLESVGVLAAGVAHRFNNLIGSILGEADLALSDLPPESAARGSVERIYEIATRASGIVRLLMAYAGSSDPGTLADIQIGRIVEETLQLVKVNLTKRITFQVEVPAALPLVRANPSQFRQIVMSLLTNALESIAGPQGSIGITASCLEINGRPVPGFPPELSAGSYVVVELTDSGCGMNEEEQRRAFDPFFSTKLFGRGLGLAAVQGILRSHGGGISMRSAPGEGSTFRVFLPCKARVREQVAPPWEQAKEAGS